MSRFNQNSSAGQRLDDIQVEQIQKNGTGGAADAMATMVTMHSPVNFGDHVIHFFHKSKKVLMQLARFMGPGFLISCAYIDPGNYATDVAAGASYRFKLLFIILLSNLFAIFLQSLCIKLGSVTGKNMPELVKEHLPPWMNYSLWFFNETAIVATDVAEVIGFAIAVNMLSNGKVPLAAGCALSIVMVLVILLFYNPGGSMKAVRLFEFGIAALVFGVVILFCIQLSMIDDVSVGEVFHGYVPSSAIVQKKGLYQACGILGATVMPHSIILGTGLVQPRLREYDLQHGIHPPVTPALDHEEGKSTSPTYKASLASIRACLPYSIAETAISLFSFAFFVNSSILIVSGASLYNNDEADDADIFGIQELLKKTIGTAAGVVFALALLLSGASAGVVCTMAGQMVSEGQLKWRLKPWQTSWITRTLSIIPSIVVAGAVGRKGIGTTLVVSQVILSCLLPIISAPLIYFTCSTKHMTISPDRIISPGQHGETVYMKSSSSSEEKSGVVEVGEIPQGTVSMRNNWLTTGLAVVIWLIITVMNVAAIVLIAIGD